MNITQQDVTGMSNDTPIPVRVSQAKPTRSSERTPLNKVYESRAIEILSFRINANVLRWLMGRRTLLAELGRIPGDEALVNAAELICRRNPRTIREAVLAVRHARKKAQTGPANPTDLAKMIRLVIHHYAEEHPDAGPDVLGRALEIVIQVIAEQKKKNEAA